MDRSARDGGDGPGFARLALARAREKPRGIPVTATLAQFAIVNVMLLTATFRRWSITCNSACTLCSAATVLGVFVLRWRQPALPRPYRTWGYPFTPLIFLAISAWMLWHLLAEKATREPSLWGLATVGLGFVVYFFSAKSGDGAANAIRFIETGRILDEVFSDEEISAPRPSFCDEWPRAGCG